MEVRFFKYEDSTMTLLPCARVDDFTSLVFTRSYSGVGKWQMTIPLTSKNAGLLMEADILHLRHGVSGLITKYTKSVEDGNEMLTVNGIELKGLVCGRIVLPPEGQAYSTYRNTDPAAVIGYLILDQLLTADESRRVPGTILWPATGSRITYSGRFSSLEEDIQGICEEFSLGYYATVNSERAIKWGAFSGKDHRKSQTENTKMIFSYANDTLDSSALEITRNKPNWLLVAGQGEGTARATAVVGNATGFRRFESYVDARDLEDDTLLPQRGQEKMAEYGDPVLFSCRVPENLVEKYGTDFDLGDLCTVEDDIAGQRFSLDARITEITECYEENDFTVDVVFGYDKSGLADVISRLKADTKGLKNKE